MSIAETSDEMKETTPFLWGASGSAFQTEGNNLASDWWHLPTISGNSIFAEASGDADDSYHHFDEDIQILAESGLNAYRFSIEWGRIEPSRGMISSAEIDHYMRVVDCCVRHHVEPIITLHHFTNPTWFSELGGWLNDESPKFFESYVRAIAPILRQDAIHYVVTFNEPNQLASIVSLMSAMQQGTIDTNRMPEPDEKAVVNLHAAHVKAREILHTLAVQVGWSLASQAFETADGSPLSELRGAGANYVSRRETDFLVQSREDDFVGVQAYTRHLVDDEGPLSVPASARTTDNGWEYYPPALAEAVKSTAAVAQVPVLITENGIATTNDEERIEYTSEALKRTSEQLAELAVPLLGYLHWSLLDNYEWGSYKPRFGLVSVDRANHFRRYPKPSLQWLGNYATNHPEGLLAG